MIFHLVELLNNVLRSNISAAMDNGNVDSPSHLGKAVAQKEALACPLRPSQHKGSVSVQKTPDGVNDALDLGCLDHRGTVKGAEIPQ